MDDQDGREDMANSDSHDGRSISSATRKPLGETGHSLEPYLQIRNLSKSYTHGVTVLKNINVDVQKGELVALLGPSGCGKTTLLNIVAGFRSADQGSILLDGEDISRVPPHKRDMPMVFQDYALIPHMSVIENIEFGIRQRKIPRAESSRMAIEALEMVQMSGYEHRRPSELSGGQQQRVALARALAVKPRAMLLDEPLSNLDALLRVSMREEIKSLLRSVGSTSILVTHDQEEALAFADQIVLINNGLIEQKGSPSFLYDNPATLFAAKFMGFENFLPVLRTEAGSEGTVVQTTLGAFRVEEESNKLAIEDWKLVIRAHELWLSPLSGDIAPCSVTDSVQHTRVAVVANSFFGQVNRLRVQRDGVEVLVADGNPLARDLNVGSTIQLNWRTESGRLVSQ